jgi:hypothetical protein
MMADDLRSTLAFLASSVAGSARSHRVVECETGLATHFDGDQLDDLMAGRRRSASIYARDRGGLLAVDRTRAGVQAYDYLTGSWLEVAVSGDVVEGYDSGSGTFITGQIAVDHVSLYDAESQRWFIYDT